jgi:hypothetical protein
MNNKEIFKKLGFCIVRSSISNELRDFVTQYALFDEMQDYSPEGSNGAITVPDAHSKYVDPAMESMLLHLHSIIEENTGLSVHPTYSYYRVYRNGDELKPHKDRPSCEISATLCFNYSYDDKEYQYPIFMDGQRVVLYPGDLVIYRGCDLKHWREGFDYATDAWHVQGFFHYVDATGPFAHHKFDDRETIGASKPTPTDNPTPQNTVDSNKSYIQYIK